MCEVGIKTNLRPQEFYPKNSTAPGPRPPILKFLDPPLCHPPHTHPMSGGIFRLDWFKIPLACCKRCLNRTVLMSQNMWQNKEHCSKNKSAKKLFLQPFTDNGDISILMKYFRVNRCIKNYICKQLIIRNHLCWVYTCSLFSLICYKNQNEWRMCMTKNQECS